MLRILGCPQCVSRNIIHDGYTTRQFVGVPIGNSKTYLSMKIRRVKCCACGRVRQETIDFAKGKRRNTIAFANMVIDLSRFATIQDIAWFLNVS